ncbi:hypothetical protein VCHA53O466_40222 [Vibrio chagasii]|nr:hypothetical protein VCHA53O466_40222 [Vibrio chagasii]
MLEEFISLVAAQPEYLVGGILVVLLTVLILRFVVSLAIKVVVIFTLILLLTGGAIHSQSDDLSETVTTAHSLILGAIKDKLQNND